MEERGRVVFKKGDLVVDDTRKRLGEVMELPSPFAREPSAILRPPKGGREWEALLDNCRPAEPGEIISADSLRVVQSQ